MQSSTPSTLKIFSTELDDPEYVAVPLSLFPPDIIKDYNLLPKVKNKTVYGKVTKGMYGLPQAGRLAHDDLVTHLATGGYYPSEHTPGLFQNKSQSVQFTLIVDDFGVKYTNVAALHHLIAHLQKKYSITHEPGTLYSGMQLKWDYVNRTCELSIPGYVFKALLRFNHNLPKRPQHSPYPYTIPQYGSRIQYSTIQHDPAICNLPPDELKRLQEILGVFRFYAMAIDSTFLTPISALATDNGNIPRKDLHARTKQFLDFAATHPSSILKYKASDMHLWAHTDASYLSESKARSRCGGFYYLSARPSLPITSNDNPPPLNGPIMANSKIIDAVMSSAQEAETGAGFFNAKEILPLRTALEELGHPQGPTPLQFDNKVATSILNDEVSQRRSKAMDMRFYWLRDRVKQHQFYVHWKRGTHNIADYYTKHHSPSHHKIMRNIVLPS